VKVSRRIALFAVAIATLAAAPAPAATPRLAPADRSAIDSVLGRFIPDAVFRENPLAARPLAAPELLAGTTKEQWAKGAIPVYPFSGRRTSFTGWIPTWIDGPRVAFTVLLHAKNRHAKVPQVLYDVVMHEIDGRWLVQSFYPAVVFGQTSITSNKDYAPGTASASPTHLGTVWFAIPAAVVGAVLGIPVVVFAVLWIRRRKARAGQGRRELPPLPESLRPPSRRSRPFARSRRVPGLRSPDRP